MTTNQKFSLDNPVLEDEIDLKTIFDALFRNKRLIAKFSLSGLVLSGLIAFTAKRVWQGEFQIVLESEKSQGSLSINRQLSNIAGLSSKSDSLTTEVAILKSPSVLMNIFQYCPRSKTNTDIYKKDTWLTGWQLVERNEYDLFDISLLVSYTVLLTDNFNISFDN